MTGQDSLTNERAEMKITQDRLKELLDYDPLTGVFVRKKTTSNQLAGKIAGYIRPDGYSSIVIDRKRYLSHRLAWLYVYGCMPSNFIDHIDHNPSNNRIDNLRDVMQTVNMQNISKPNIDSLTGHLGVTYSKEKSKFQAQIRIDGKNKFIGRFHTAEEAHIAYVKAKREFHEGCTI